MYNYIGVLHKASAISHSIKCNFLNNESKINLIVAKSNIIEIYNITKEGIEPTPFININGTIILLEAFPSGINNQDNLFILTEDLDYSIIGYKGNKIVDYAKGSIKEDIGKKQDSIIYSIDRQLQVIILSAYKNIFKVIMLNNEKKGQYPTFPLRNNYDDLLFLFPFHIGNISHKAKSISTETLTMNFGVIKTAIATNSNQGNSTIISSATGNQTNTSIISLETFRVNLTKAEINKEISYTYDYSFNPTMSMVISNELGYFIVFFSSYLVCYQVTNGKLIEKKNICYPDRKFITNCQMETTKYLVVDEYGNLFFLAIVESIEKNDIIFQFLGEINYASSLTYLDANYLFAASQKSNSQLVKILTQLSSIAKHMPFIEIVEEYESLAPITDFTVINNTKDVNSIEIISVSGSEKNCSLKNLRKGTSLIIEGEIHLEGITNAFKINYYDSNSMIIDNNNNDNDDNTPQNKKTLLIGTLVNSTIFLNLSFADNNYNISLSNKIVLEEEEKVFYACNITNGNIIVITNQKRLMYDTYFNLLCQHKFDIILGRPLIVKYHNKTSQLYIFFSGSILQKYDCSSTESFVNKIPQNIIENLNLTAFDICEFYMIYSVWDSNDIYIYSFGSKKANIFCNIEENGNILVSSIQIIKKEGTKFVFISLSNGKLIYYKLKTQFRNWPHYDINSDDFLLKRKYNISTENFEIKKNKNDKTTCLFLTTPIPSLLYLNKESPVLSNFNVKSCSEIISLNSNKNSYAFILSDRIAFGSLSTNQSQSILSKNYNSQIYSLSQISLGKDLPFLALILEEKIDEKMIASFVLLGLNFHEIARYKLDYDNEISSCFAEMNYYTDRKIFALGTGISENISIEPISGHIYLLEITDAFKINKICETETKGAVYKIACQNNIIFVATGPTLYIYQYDIEIKLIRKCVLFTLINDLSFFNSDLVISDIYRSIALYSYDIEKEKLKDISRDYNPVWIYSVSQCNSNMMYLSDVDGNIISAKKELYPKSDEEKYKLERKAMFNYGERINKMVTTKLRGKEMKDICIVDNMDEINVTYFGTLEGSIGIIIQLTKETYEFLYVLQTELAKTIVSIGSFEYEKWRSFKDGFIIEPSNGFIEGALLQEFLNFEDSYRKQFLKQLNYPWQKNVSDIINMIEMLLKYH